MKMYWHYECEYNHGWVLMRDKDAEESLDDTFCPWGHEAIILRKCDLTLRLQVSIRPAEERDSVGKTFFSHRFYLVLTDIFTNQERMSKQNFGHVEISELLTKFLFLSVEQGWRLLDKIENIE
jgi:hypothetical protein